MPLKPGKSQKAFEHNVKAEMQSGKPQNQSLAIAYSVKKKNAKKKASGGSVQSGSRDMNYADGGAVSASNEQRPSTQQRANDSDQIAHNRAHKPAHNDNWLDQPTVAQAQRPSRTPLKHPKMVPQSVYSVRLRDEEDHLQDSARTNQGAQHQPPAHDNEERPNRQGPSVHDMEREHNNGRKPYAAGGKVIDEDAMEMSEREDEAHMQSQLSPSHDEGDEYALEHEEVDGNRQGPPISDTETEHDLHNIHEAEENEDHDMELNPAHGQHSADDSEDQPEEEAEMEHHDSIAASIMAKQSRQRQHSDSDIDHEMMMALGGEIIEDDNDIHSHGSMDTHESSSQADLSRNADEDANEEDQASFNALRKENYSESEGLSELDQPRDSNLHSDSEELDAENQHDRVSRIISKMNRNRQFKQR